MSKVNVLAAIDFPIGTVKLVHFEDLDKAGTINLSDLPDVTFEATQLDSALQKRLYLVVTGNGSDRQSYNHQQLHELVQEKLVEMLRLEDVVKTYGTLMLDMPPRDPSEHPDHFSYRVHPLEHVTREVVGALFKDGDGHGRYHYDNNEVVSYGQGQHNMKLKLPGGLEMFADTKEANISERHPRGFGYHTNSKIEDHKLCGSFDLAGIKFHFSVTHPHFPIRKCLVFQEAAHSIALTLIQHFPFIAVDAVAFTKAIVQASAE